MSINNKKQLSEQDIRSEFITSVIVEARWNLQVQVREGAAITKGRILVRGKYYKRAQPKYADYIFYYKPEITIAALEAKDNYHAAFDQPPLTRKERANKGKKKDYFVKYGDQAKLVIEALLDKYADDGVENLEDLNVFKVPSLNQMGTPAEIVRMFGGKEGYQNVVREIDRGLYA